MLITAKDKEIKKYYEELAKIENHDNEGNQAPLFLNLLRYATSQIENFKLVEQHSFKGNNKKTIRPDATIFNENGEIIGIFEAKDSKDDLSKEIYNKIHITGYPNKNILFQSPKEAILIQNGKEVLKLNIKNSPENIALIINKFFDYSKEQEIIDSWNTNAEKFQENIPYLAKKLREIIQESRIKNKEFIQQFETFFEQIRDSINPNISKEAVEEMLIQHVLTEQVFRKVFDHSDFRENNIIAREIEKVIKTLTSSSFNRDLFFKDVQHHYESLEEIAHKTKEFSKKQSFLNDIYERFFQSFSEKTADTHGIVYTPQPVVKFMIKSVNHILQEHFNKNLSHRDVKIIDPFVGTGNFIVNLMKEIHSISKLNFENKYLNELHCNEIMLLPYYIACMNIEHEFLELTGNYKPFQNICLVDTFELAEAKQITIFSQENTERIKHQKESDIFVVIGNPPYNAHQINENDNNKNRKYDTLDKRVKETYTSDSKATNKIALQDVYVKAFRWATDRLNKDYGIVAFVTNNSFIDGIAFDGMRKHLNSDFNQIYIIDLGGNVRKNTKLSGTKHNVFGIQVGVCITLLIKNPNQTEKKIFYTRFNEFNTSEEKLKFLDEAQYFKNLDFTEIIPNSKNNWLYDSSNDDFDNFIPMGTKDGKSGKSTELTLFKIYSAGIKTNRDSWAFNHNINELENNINKMTNFYNDHVLKYDNSNIDEFVSCDDTKISWSNDLKLKLKSRKKAEFSKEKIVVSAYRPYSKQYLYFDKLFNNSIHLIPKFFDKNINNKIISVSGLGSNNKFIALITNLIPECQLLTNAQFFPLYTYTESGEQVCNIPNATISHLNTLYNTSNIDAETIFYYVYGLLHHEDYKAKYQANLRIELPRIPFVATLEDFQAIHAHGRKLANLHLNYENVEAVITQEQLNFKYRYLDLVENPNAQLDLKVSKMKYNKKTNEIIYNNFLTIKNIPIEANDYQLGNKSALEWIIDQYQIKQDKRSGIINDPNDEEQPKYILNLIENIINLSLIHIEIVKQISSIKL